MNKLNLSQLAASLVNDKWLLDSKIHANLCKMVDKLINDPLPPTYGEAEEFKFEESLDNKDEANMTAVINVNGILIKGASPLEEEFLGLVNTDFISNAIDNALEDESVSQLVLVFASPGGRTCGIEELGRKIKAADAIKPTYCWTEQLCCSAAYWLASQGRMIGMTPSSVIGNVGVYSLIEDSSKAMEMAGVNIQAISAGKYKLMGQPFRKLTEEELKILQDDITKQHIKFKDAIKSNRNIDDANMEGLMYEGEEALKYGYADVVVDTFNEYLTTVQTIDTTKQMKSYTKQATVAPITKEAVASVTPNTPLEVVNTNTKQAEMPGVPGITEEKKSEEVAPEPKKEESKKVECPYCKKAFDPNEPHSEPDKDDKKETAVESKKEETAVVASVPEIKAEPSKKAVMPSMTDWKTAMGQPLEQKNPLYESALEVIKNFTSIK